MVLVIIVQNLQPKCFAIYIDECLTWRNHVAYVNSKMFRAIFAIKQLKFTIPLSILRTLLCINPTTSFVWNTCMGKCYFSNITHNHTTSEICHPYYPQSWYRSIEAAYAWFDLCAHNGITLNPKKFQFAQDTVDFAELSITPTNI